MCVTGVLHVGKYDREDGDDSEELKDQVQLRARGGGKVGVATGKDYIFEFMYFVILYIRDKNIVENSKSG